MTFPFTQLFLCFSIKLEGMLDKIKKMQKLKCCK